jgi:hypothetical protein
MVRFDSWRAVRLGNGSCWNLATKSTLGGRATWQAVTRVKLEQASKATIAGARHLNNHSAPIRTTGVVSRACQEGSLCQWGRPGRVEESRTSNGIYRMPDPLGVGEGQRYLRSRRVMPVEGRTLASGVLVKEERSGD